MHILTQGNLKTGKGRTPLKFRLGATRAIQTQKYLLDVYCYIKAIRSYWTGIGFYTGFTTYQTKYPTMLGFHSPSWRQPEESSNKSSQISPTGQFLKPWKLSSLYFHNSRRKRRRKLMLTNWFPLKMIIHSLCPYFIRKITFKRRIPFFLNSVSVFFSPILSIHHPL